MHLKNLDAASSIFHLVMVKCCISIRPEYTSSKAAALVAKRVVKTLLIRGFSSRRRNCDFPRRNAKMYADSSDQVFLRLTIGRFIISASDALDREKEGGAHVRFSQTLFVIPLLS